MFVFEFVLQGLAEHKDDGDVVQFSYDRLQVVRVEEGRKVFPDGEVVCGQEAGRKEVDEVGRQIHVCDYYFISIAGWDGI